MSEPIDIMQIAVRRLHHAEIRYRSALFMTYCEVAQIAANNAAIAMNLAARDLEMVKRLCLDIADDAPVITSPPEPYSA